MNEQPNGQNLENAQLNGRMYASTTYADQTAMPAYTQDYLGFNYDTTGVTGQQGLNPGYFPGAQYLPPTQSYQGLPSVTKSSAVGSSVLENSLKTPNFYSNLTDHNLAFTPQGTLDQLKNNQTLNKFANFNTLNPTVSQQKRMKSVSTYHREKNRFSVLKSIGEGVKKIMKLLENLEAKQSRNRLKHSRIW